MKVKFLTICMIVTMVMVWALPAMATQIPVDVDWLWSAPPTWPEANEGSTSDDPYWITGSGHTRLYVPNFAQPEPWSKKVYLELTFKDLQTRGLASNMPIFVPASVPESYESSSAWPSVDPSDPLVVTWTWTIEPQPPWEILDLGNTIWALDPIGGSNPVQEINVASKCVPEPATICLLGLGGLGLLHKRKSA